MVEVAVQCVVLCKYIAVACYILTHEDTCLVQWVVVVIVVVVPIEQCLPALFKTVEQCLLHAIKYVEAYYDVVVVGEHGGYKMLYGIPV